METENRNADGVVSCEDQRAPCAGMARAVADRATVAFLASLLTLVAASSLQASTLVVDDPISSSSGSATTCQLGDAIEAANTGVAVGGCDAGSVGMDVIVFDGSLSEITLTGGLPQITDDLVINGPGSGLLAITGGLLADLFDFGESTVGAIRGLTIRDGDPFLVSSCLSVLSDVFVVEDIVVEGCEETAASFLLVGDLLISGMVIREHTYSGSESALVISGSTGTVEDLLVHDTTCSTTSSRCAVSVGSVSTVGGSFGSDLVMRRVTVTDNEGGYGSAISVVASNSSLHIEHSTISGNRMHNLFVDRGILRSNGTLSLRNTIVAGNTRVDFAGPPASIDLGTMGTVTSLGNNLIGTNQGTTTTFPAGSPNGGGDYAGTYAAPLAAGLMGLADNGGPMSTMMPLNISLAVDSGNCPGETVDQRGFNDLSSGLRPVDIALVANDDDGCDIGAVERNAQSPWIFGDGFESGNTLAWDP